MANIASGDMSFPSLAAAKILYFCEAEVRDTPDPARISVMHIKE